MATKILQMVDGLKTVHKHNTEANWDTDTSFVPSAGEAIVYDPDASHQYPRLKIGDGTTNVNDLPFITEHTEGIKNFKYLGVNRIDEISLDFISTWVNVGSGFLWIDSTKDNYNSQSGFILTLPINHREGLLLNYVQNYDIGGRVVQEFISNSGGKFWRTATINNESSYTTVGNWNNYQLGSYPVGSICTTSTNTSPAAELGGDWELVDKEFRNEAKSSTEIFSTTTSAVTTSTNYYAIGGHSLRFRVAINYAGTLSATNLMMGTINLNAMGATGLGFPITDAVAFSDNSSVGVAYTISNTTSTLGQVTFRNKFGTGSGTAHNFYIDHTIVLNKDRMLDEFCDKFHWKRIA